MGYPARTVTRYSHDNLQQNRDTANPQSGQGEKRERVQQLEFLHWLKILHQQAMM
jgi:hypothetical protein